MTDSLQDNALNWLCSKLDSLGTAELYEVFRLRAEVFIVEQNCAYQDLDGKDQSALHLLGLIDTELCCYARLLPPGVSYPDASIGRIVTSPERRGAGFGRLVLAESIRQCRILWPGSGITISAQQYLEQFYQEFGFVSESEPYSEDGIPHIRMSLSMKPAT